MDAINGEHGGTVLLLLFALAAAGLLFWSATHTPSAEVWRRERSQRRKMRRRGRRIRRQSIRAVQRAEQAIEREGGRGVHRRSKHDPFTGKDDGARPGA